MALDLGEARLAAVVEQRGAGVGRVLGQPGDDAVDVLGDDLRRESGEEPELVLDQGPAQFAAEVEVVALAHLAGDRVVDAAQRRKAQIDDLAQDRLWHPHLHELGEVEVKHGAKLGVVNLYTEELGNPDVPQKFRQLGRQAKMPRSGPETKPGKLRWALGAAAVVIVGALMVLIGRSGPESPTRNQNHC